MPGATPALDRTTPKIRNRIPNREGLRLETPVTQTKQRSPSHSNRENNGVLRPHSHPAHKTSNRISNREPLRLEIPVTQTKQTSPPHSNRENKAILRPPPPNAERRVGAGVHYRPGLALGLQPLTSRQIPKSPPAKSPKKSDLNASTTLQLFFRVGKIRSLIPFHLQRNLIEPMFRLENGERRIKTGEKNTRECRGSSSTATPGCAELQCAKKQSSPRTKRQQSPLSQYFNHLAPVFRSKRGSRKRPRNVSSGIAGNGSQRFI
jgi:hypothetical protein